MENFYKAINLAAKIREESYDNEKASKAEFTDYNKFYQKTLVTACKQAAEKMNLDDRQQDLIYLLLKTAWNDTLAITEKFK